ncbi:MAG: PAS domain S-box protein [Ignavibacteriaceae bacterium]
MTSNIKTPAFNKKPLYLLTLAFILLLAAGAYLYYDYQEGRIRTEKQNNLRTISNLKINEISRWRKERLSEAQFFPGNEMFITNTRKLLNKKDTTLQKYFTRTLNPIKINHKYDNIFISSPGGEILFSLVPALTTLDSITKNSVSQAIERKEIIFDDFFYCPVHKKIHLEIVSPVIHNGQAIAAMILRIDPGDYLYPLIQTWPVYSKTAESLIFRVENGKVVLLNDLRHRKNSALNIKIPLERKDVIAVKAALGAKGIIEGVDYRDEAVLANINKIPGTPWFLVTKIDHSEIYEELRQMAMLVIINTAILILLIITGLTLFSVYQQKRFYIEMLIKDRYLLEAQEEFRTTLYSIGDAVITTDVKGCIKQMNAVAEEMTGWKEHEAAGRYIEDVFKIVNEDTKSIADSPVKRVLREGNIIGLANHTILISRTGAEIPIADSGSPIKNEAGNIIGVILVFRNQSSEREAEKKLRESEERYKSLFRNNHTIMLLLDPDSGSITDANPAALNYYGYNHDQITQLKVWDINELPPDAILEKMQQTIETEAARYQFTHKLASGALRDVEVYSGPITLNGKKLLYSIVHDVTERSLAEKALRASEDKFSTAFAVSPDSININRLSDGLYFDVNRGFCEITGYTREEVIGKTSSEINIWVNPEDRKRLVKAINEKGEVNNLEAEFRKKDGSTLIALMSARIIVVNGETCSLNISRDITEKKKSDEALKKSEERLRLFVEHAPAAIAMLDKDMRYLSVSKRWLTDYKLDLNRDVTGLSHYEIFPEISEEWKEIHRRCLAGNNEKCDEDPFLRKDGSMDWIKWEIHPWQNEKNETGGIIIFSEVITERKKAEEAIKEKTKLEEQLGKIAGTAPGGLFSFKMSSDGTYSIPYASPIWEDIIGVKKEEIIKDFSPVFNRIHPDDREKLISTIETSAQEMIDWHLEFRIINAGKKFTWVEGNSTPIKQGDGSIIWHGFITNITGRKESEERIWKLSRGIEQSPAIIVMTDINGLIEYVNPKFTAVTGYTLDEVKGRNPKILKSGNKSKEEYEILWNTILSKNEWRGEFLNKKKSGELFWESALISPLLNEEGKIISFIAVKEDITELKKMTNELIEAKEKAEEMNRVKSYFFANISHELRTPFVGIIGFSELLSERLTNPEEKRMAEVILSSSKRLTDTLNKILDISKLEFDKTEIRAKETDVFTIIESLYHLYSKSAEKRNTKIKIEINPVPLLWRTDEKLLREITANLINNAVKFTSDGLISIFAGIFSDKESNHLVIKVSDTGVGIPKDKQDIIWHEFRQASEGYNRSFEGTGLGLSITRKYAELLGGKITLESEPGKGSVFTVVLPEINTSEYPVVNEVPPSNELKIVSNIKENKSRRVLYIEDDSVSIDYVKKVLSKRFLVDVAEDAERALDYVRNNNYDVLLLDINLGYGMNGIELMQEIKQMSAYTCIPIVAVTAYASLSNKKDFLSRGFTHYISKPFSSKQLVELLEEILSQESRK